MPPPSSTFHPLQTFLKQFCSSSSAPASSSSASPATLRQTKQLHALLLVSSSISSLFAVVNLLRSYAAHGDLSSARVLFDVTPNRPVLLWNAIIRAHARVHHLSFASALLARLRRDPDAQPDGRTFACLLRACAEGSDVRGARTLHALAFFCGLSGACSIVDSAVVSSYSKLGLVGDARSMFDGSRVADLVMWNSMISGYGYGGLWREGVATFVRMRREADEDPDGYSLVAIISCFWESSALPCARAVHGLCLKGGHDCGQHVRSALVSMYSRCGCVLSGYRVFKGLSNPDLVTWSALISGFSLAGQCADALALFAEMTNSGERPDSVLISAVLSSCASIASFRPGKEVHCHALRHGMDGDVAVSCSLIDMYAKCGLSRIGDRMLGLIPERNTITYNAVIQGLGSHGLAREAMSAFDAMLARGFVPDEATFSSLLHACCHAGLLEQGWYFFRRMQEEFSLSPRTEHCVHIVKLLATSGHLKEAYDFILMMPCQPDSSIWGVLLWGCNIHCDLALGKIVAEKLFEMAPRKPAYRVMLANLYAAENRWLDVDSTRDQMTLRGLRDGRRDDTVLDWMRIRPPTRIFKFRGSLSLHR